MDWLLDWWNIFVFTRVNSASAWSSGYNRRDSQEFNKGLEFDDDVLLGHIEEVVRNKREGIKWRFATERVMEHGALLPTKILGFFSFRGLFGKIAAGL